jgi:hypothetical protein
MLGALQSAFREPAFLQQGGDALTTLIYRRNVIDVKGIVESS